MIGRVRQNPRPKAEDRPLDATAKLVQDSQALLLGRLRPLFEPAIVGLFGLDSRLVTQPPHEGEVGVDLALEHRLKVELNIGLSGQPAVVAQDTQAQAVGHEPPETIFRSVEKLLDETVRARLAGPILARNTSVEIVT